MGSLDNMMTNIETWAFLPTFDNSWIAETFFKETDALTKALTHAATTTTTNSNGENVSFSETPSSVQLLPNVSSSETETHTVSKRPPRNPVKKIAKRKTRASKRSNTTFITADPANFRQMVQQVTGVRFGTESGPVVKPEPHRAGFGSGQLPTLDTSAFLLDHRQNIVGPANFGGGPGVGSTGRAGFDFDGFSCFPTLESWKVM